MLLASGLLSMATTPNEAVGIVDALEVVDVEHDKREFTAIALHPQQFHLGQFDKITPIEQAGQSGRY
jgi:hypothetical protein